MFFLKCFVFLISIHLVIRTDLKIDFFFSRLQIKKISASWITKIVSIVLFVFLFEKFSADNWWICALVVSWTVILRKYEALTKLFIKQQISKYELSYLDSIILTSSSGISVFESMKSSVNVFPSYIRGYFLESIVRMKMSEMTKLPDLWGGFVDFDVILKSNHRQIEQLRSMRRTIYLAKVLERKKESALSLVQTQMMVISILYFGGCYFVFSKYSIYEFKNYFIFSAFLYCLSLFSVNFLKRINPWTI